MCLCPNFLFYYKDTLNIGLGATLTVVKKLPASAGDSGEVGLIPGPRRFLEEGNGNPVQYACLGNPMDRGSWRATVHGVAKSQTRLGIWAHTWKIHPVLDDQMLWCLATAMLANSHNHSLKYKHYLKNDG